MILRKTRNVLITFGFAFLAACQGGRPTTSNKPGDAGIPTIPMTASNGRDSSGGGNFNIAKFFDVAYRAMDLLSQRKNINFEGKPVDIDRIRALLPTLMVVELNHRPQIGSGVYDAANTPSKRKIEFNKISFDGKPPEEIRRIVLHELVGVSEIAGSDEKLRYRLSAYLESLCEQIESEQHPTRPEFSHVFSNSENHSPVAKGSCDFEHYPDIQREIDATIDELKGECKESASFSMDECDAGTINIYYDDLGPNGVPRDRSDLTLCQVRVTLKAAHDFIPIIEESNTGIIPVELCNDAQIQGSEHFQWLMDGPLKMCTDKGFSKRQCESAPRVIRAKPNALGSCDLHFELHVRPEDRSQ